jgi:hypothetical protein
MHNYYISSAFKISYFFVAQIMQQMSLLHKSCNKIFCCIKHATNRFVALYLQQIIVKMRSKKYIIMADIINSGNRESKTLMVDFKTLTKKINTTFKAKIVSPLTITLGDEFQGLLNNIVEVIEMIIKIEELIIKQRYEFKLRYVVHFGNIETAINTKRSYEMLGPGLTKAREKLEDLKNTNHRFDIETNNKSQSYILNESFKIFQTIVDKWDLNDYELANAFIELKDYSAVAKKLKKDRSLMWRREKTLNMDNYFSIKNIIQESMNIK